MSRALLLVAHGSRDPEAQSTTESLADLVRAELPGLDVAIGYLDHAAPSVPVPMGSVVMIFPSFALRTTIFAGFRHDANRM